MKDIIKSILKILFITLALSLVILLFPKENKVDAKITVSKGSKVLTTDPSNKEKYATSQPITSIVSGHASVDASQQIVGSNVFLSCGEFINNKPPYYSLFCCGHGERLTSVNLREDYSTKKHVGYVLVKGKKVDTTDSGRKIALLYGPYLSGEKVYYKNTDATVDITVYYDDDYTSSRNTGLTKAKEKAAGTIFESGDIESVTYGYYTNSGREKATPAEAYILTEMRNNTVRNNYVQLAWWNIISSGGSTGSAGGGGNGVIGGSSYTVDITSDDEDNAYGTPDADNLEKTGGLFTEANDFQNYILAVADSAGGHHTPQGMKSQYNSYGMFDIDYKNCVSEIDTSDVDVLFDYKTNTYRVGPFSVDYIRAAVKTTNREAVNFAGIAEAKLKVQDENGKVSLLRLRPEYYDGAKGFRIVYDHQRTLQYYDVNDYKDYVEGDNFWYPYPYPGEKFYIELDYKEDITSIKELKFDFHWSNGGAEYENLREGNAYLVKWKIESEWKEDLGHRDDGDWHGEHYVYHCHTHEHVYYKFRFWVYLEIESYDEIETQKFINCIYSKIGIYKAIDAELDIDLDIDELIDAGQIEIYPGGDTRRR